jgi:hypothetical protein
LAYVPDFLSSLQALVATHPVILISLRAGMQQTIGFQMVLPEGLKEGTRHGGDFWRLVAHRP